MYKCSKFSPAAPKTSKTRFYMHISYINRSKSAPQAPKILGVWGIYKKPPPPLIEYRVPDFNTGGFIINRSDICTGVSHMLNDVLIKRKIAVLTKKWTSFISDLAMLTVDSGSKILMIFAEMVQFHQRFSNDNCGSRVPKNGSLCPSVVLRQSDATIVLHHLMRFVPLFCRVLSSMYY